MSLSDKTVKEIKSIIQKFINENGFVKSEEDVQSSYTLEILKLLEWDSSKWKINTPQEVKTGNKPDIFLKGSSGSTIFIIESKAPKQSLDNKYSNKTFSEQICEYCNSEGIYWGILTNFNEWRIYNSYTKEIYYNQKYFTIKDDKVNDENDLYEFFDKISFNNLNKRKGKIDTNPIYYKRQDEIKDEFFDNLKRWRKNLRDYLYNLLKKKSDKNIPEKVERLTQKILDRLIFIEVCNDKDIISCDILGSILYSKRNKYEELKSKFKELDEKFDSDLFADDVDIDSLEIDDVPMEEIIRGINHIDFSGLSVHIIGEVYENYLGELLKKRKHEIKIDETKERAKRKEQGIYYTPDYIVNYIVENTLGEILKNCKTREEIQKIRVLDPACGSGSFLIRAFDEFHKAYLNCSDKLSLFDDFEIKKKILLYNLYGVDLDERAVDIAKLNLLIKALEGTSDTAIEGKRKLLPNLNLNIRCGNSLVSGNSINNSHKDGLFDDSENYDKDIKILTDLKEIFKNAVEKKDKGKYLNEIYILEEKINSLFNKDICGYFKNPDDVKPFNYEVAFCEIFKDGGFDCVIGNPPYVEARQLPQNIVNFLRDNFESTGNRANVFTAFIEKSLTLIPNDRFFGMIIHRNIIRSNDYIKIRNIILENCKITHIGDFKSGIFENVTGEMIVLCLQKSNNIDEIKRNNIILYGSDKNSIILQDIFYRIPGNRFNIYLNNKKIKLLDKIEKNTCILKNTYDIKQGIIVGDEKKYISNNKSSNKYKPILRGRDITRYSYNFNNEYLYYEPGTKILTRGKEPELFERKKILTQHVNSKVVACIDDNNYYVLQTINIIYKNTNDNIDDFFILGLLNSSLLNFYYESYYNLGAEFTTAIAIENLEQLPICTIDFNNKQEKSLHDKLVKLVDEMLVFNKNPEKNEIKIKAKDKEIDDLVYKLYDLTDDDIKIVGGKE